MPGTGDMPYLFVVEFSRRILFLCICFFCLQVPYFEHSSRPYLDKGVTGAVKMASLSHGRLGRLDGKLHLEWPSIYFSGPWTNLKNAQRCSKALFLRATPHDSQEMPRGWPAMNWKRSQHIPTPDMVQSSQRDHSEGICGYMQLLIFICFLLINIIK